MENKKRNELIKRITRDINKLDTVTLGRINAFTMGIMGDKAMEFEQKQDVEGMDGSMVYTKCLVDGNEERVEFDGTVYMACKECGEEISMDIRELISHETASEDFTEFKGFTCHDCIQKEKQAVEPNKIRGNR